MGSEEAIRKDARIFVAGHAGLIGSAMVRRLVGAGYSQVLTRDRKELDLRNGLDVNRFFAEARPAYVILAAGRVGGIVENQTHPSEFLTENLAIQLSVMQAARSIGVQRLIFFGSSCMYPRDCAQPMAEAALWSGAPEPTSRAYATAKLAGIELCLAFNRQDGAKRFIPVIPNSVYGPGDEFDPLSGHVLAALIARFHAAKASGATEVTLWGTGSPRREFIHADDLADACLHMLQQDLQALELPLNIGTGEEVSIQELALKIAAATGFRGRVAWDSSRPDGAPRKLLNSMRLRELGWNPKITLDDGLAATCAWYEATLAAQAGGI